MAPKKKVEKRRLSPFQRFLKYIYRIAVALSAVIVALFVVWKLAIRPPEVAQPTAPAIPRESPLPGSGEGAGGAPGGEESTLQRRDQTYTFLLIAQDQVSSSTDTLIAVTYDVPNKKVGMVSIPRDTLVDRKVGPYRYYKINAAYGNAETNSPGSGIGELKDAVSDLLGIPIDYYVMVDVPSFVRIVDAVGGVDFEVPVYMDYDAPDQDLHIHYEAKLYRGLSGKQVMEIARCRKNTIWKGGSYTLYDAYPDAEIGRTRTQQALLKAIAKKLISWNSIPRITKLAGIVNESVETNMPLDDMLFFAQNGITVDLAAGLTTATFPGDGTVTYRGVDYCYLYDKAAALELINTLLNPYTTEVTEDMADIFQIN